jgi:hypothetical protein
MTQEKLQGKCGMSEKSLTNMLNQMFQLFFDLPSQTQSMEGVKEQQ